MSESSEDISEAFEVKYPLHYAAARGNLPAVKHLIEQGYNVDSQAEGRMNWTALHYAAHYNRVTVVDYLLSCNANKYISNLCGRTPSGVTKNDKILKLLQ